MSFFKNFMDKLTKGFFYVVDINVLSEHLYNELEFTLENDLEASAHLNIYYNGEKHEIQVWNYAVSNSNDEKGVIVYLDNAEYKSIEDLLEHATISNIKLKDIQGYFKIELLDIDSEFLNEYRNNHPELNVEDYN